MNRIHPYFLAALIALFGCATLGLWACAPEGSLGVGDDDDISPGDDDDDDDDDDTVGDDDDTVPPDGFPIGGTIHYSIADGTLAEAPVRVGFFLNLNWESVGVERFSAEVSESGLTAGGNIFTVYIDEVPESDLADVGLGVPVTSYFLFAYSDLDDSGSYNDADALLGASESIAVYFDAETAEEIPFELSFVGAGPGWNFSAYESLTSDAPSFDWSENWNSSNGPSIEVELLPVESGTLPVSSDLWFPEGSTLAAVHASFVQAFDDAEVDVVSDPFLFQTGIENEGGSWNYQWSLDGPPPDGHLFSVGSLAGPGSDPEDEPLARGEESSALMALYSVGSYFDDGDGVFSNDSACDRAESNDPLWQLLWIEVDSLSLSDAFYSQVNGYRMGWSLWNQETDILRALSAGVVLSFFTFGDDDDSAGGDDDDSAGEGNIYGIPEECLPEEGDDDDSSAGGDDDDSSAGGDDDDSSAGGDDDDSAAGGDDDDSSAGGDDDDSTAGDDDDSSAGG